MSSFNGTLAGVGLSTERESFGRRGIGREATTLGRSSFCGVAGGDSTESPFSLG